MIPASFETTRTIADRTPHRTPSGSIVSNLVLWSCCALAAINILAAIIEWRQFQTFLVFSIFWWFELGLSCLAIVIILYARLPGWRVTAACMAAAVGFIAMNTVALGLTLP